LTRRNIINANFERHFAEMGARVKLRTDSAVVRGAGISINIGRDRFGEFYDIAADRNDDRGLFVLDLQSRIRHLLLSYNRPAVGQNSKFLCGHDERHWFVAAIPEASGASSVRTAMEALKPPVVRYLQEQLRVKPKKRNRRRNEAFVRQGEWFFVPSSRPAGTEAWMVLRNEPLRRGNGKPHFAEELVRLGGETVYVCHQYPSGLTQSQYEGVISRQPKLHQVLMNTETQALAMRHVAFID
jgi:hypothetical protein